MWHQEEVKCSIDNFRLLDETIVNIGTLRRIGDHGIAMSALLTTHLKESLSYSFVDNDQSDLRHLKFGGTIFFFFFLITSKRVLLSNNLIELLKLMLDNLLSHWISYTISVDKYMVG